MVAASAEGVESAALPVCESGYGLSAFVWKSCHVEWLWPSVELGRELSGPNDQYVCSGRDLVACGPLFECGLAGAVRSELWERDDGGQG